MSTPGAASRALRVRLGGGTPAERLAIVEQDRRDGEASKLAPLWTADAVYFGRRGDLTNAYRSLQQVRDHVAEMERRR